MTVATTLWAGPRLPPPPGLSENHKAWGDRDAKTCCTRVVVLTFITPSRDAQGEKSKVTSVMCIWSSPNSWLTRAALKPHRASPQHGPSPASQPLALAVAPASRQGRNWF